MERRFVLVLQGQEYAIVETDCNFFLPLIRHFIVQEKVFWIKVYHGMNEQCACCLWR